MQEDDLKIPEDVNQAEEEQPEDKRKAGRVDEETA